jgi:type I restriction enzyme S subunit
MKSSYKKLGNYIQIVNKRDSSKKIDKLLGVSIRKVLIPSIANIIGTDMSTYKIIQKNQFAYGPVTSRNGDKISVAVLDEYEEAIVSQAYTVFDVIDKNELLPEYLMMWFRRSEFDRYARFKSHGSAREIFGWDEMCDTELPIPSIEKQREIVKEYHVIQNQMALNNQLIFKLEETAQAIYKQWFVEGTEENWEEKSIGDLCSLITDGKHGDCQNEINSGYYFVSVKDLINGDIFYSNVRQITKKDFEETHKRTDLNPGDILITSSGTIGRMIIVKENPKTYRTTLQKSVAILKPIAEIAPCYYLFSMLNSEMKNIIELAGGSTIANLLLGDLKRFKIKYPGQSLIYQYEKVITPIYKNIELKNKEIQNLTELKDLLLARMTRVESEKELI